jgi:hypothetical protein
MARDQLILPRADSGCGKVFYEDRRTADGHRIALEFWNRATGYTREGYQLSVYRCNRCGGFHIGQRRIEKRSSSKNKTCTGPSPPSWLRKSLPAAEETR